MTITTLATDWATISALATAFGTLVLAVATFSSVRSANRSARTSELALQESRRPVLVNSRDDDATLSVPFTDRGLVSVPGGTAALEVSDAVAYLIVSLRNVGSGIAVLQSWHLTLEVEANTPPPELDGFRPMVRDQYIAPGDVGLWQAAVRDASDDWYAGIRDAVNARRRFGLELLYTDQVGGQRTITRFGLVPDDDVPTGWYAASARHWYLDAPQPR